MKKEDAIKRSRKVTVRFTEAEYNRLCSQFKSTTKRKFSEYIRSVLLNKKIVVYTRSKSLDDFMAELVVLRTELSAVGNNFNQAVKKLHAMDHIAEIRVWANLNEKSKESFFKKVDEIKEKINQISDKWLHE